MIETEKPGTPSELAHHGVKGMKWGVQRSRQFGAKYPTGHARAKEIRRARARSQKKFTDYTTEELRGGKRKQLKLAYLKDPDRATALRMTRGEKFAAAIVAGALAPTVVAPIAVGATVGGRVAFRRHVEKKQARGGYK